MDISTFGRSFMLASLRKFALYEFRSESFHIIVIIGDNTSA